MRTVSVSKPDEDVSSDGDERIRDFLTRHGGAAASPTRRETDPSGIKGWSEVYATDGYTLRCDWSRFGSRAEMSFTESAPTGGPATEGTR